MREKLRSRMTLMTQEYGCCCFSAILPRGASNCGPRPRAPDAMQAKGVKVPPSALWLRGEYSLVLFLSRRSSTVKSGTVSDILTVTHHHVNLRGPMWIKQAFDD